MAGKAGCRHGNRPGRADEASGFGERWLSLHRTISGQVGVQVLAEGGIKFQCKPVLATPSTGHSRALTPQRNPSDELAQPCSRPSPRPWPRSLPRAARLGGAGPGAGNLVPIRPSVDATTRPGPCLRTPRSNGRQSVSQSPSWSS